MSRSGEIKICYNVAENCHSVAKTVTTCCQNLLYGTSVTKMWHFCSLLWLVDFLSQMENKTAVLPSTIWFQFLQSVELKMWKHIRVPLTKKKKRHYLQKFYLHKLFWHVLQCHWNLELDSKQDFFDAVTMTHNEGCIFQEVKAIFSRLVCENSSSEKLLKNICVAVMTSWSDWNLRPCRTFFKLRNSQKSHGTISELYGGCATVSICFDF